MLTGMDEMRTAMTRAIDYGGMMHRAMQGLIAEVLTRVAKEGLPGEHHFFITFDTREDGVEIADWLRERYPAEMTIVIQHQYWELLVNETSFEIGLSFSGVPEKLVVPFASIRGFFDPSVEFAVQFPLVDESGNAADVTEDGPVKAIGPASGGPKAPRPAAKAPAADKPAKSAEPAKPAVEDKPEDGDKPPTVVSLDAFRKKP